MKSEELLYPEDLGELFVDVQAKRIFSDQKFFTDCVPKFSVDEILRNYGAEKKNTGFDLEKFCKNFFDYPKEESSGFVSDKSKTVEGHIQALWDILTRQPKATGGTLIKLPYPFVVPGGRFQEVYYWDSYFTMLGLQVSKKIELIENMVDNFAYLIDEFGFIPNGNRTYFLSRSQPPFFSLMVELLSEERGKEIVLKYLPHLEKECQFWMKGKDLLDKKNKTEKRVVKMTGGEVLNRYWDNMDTPRQEAFAEDIETAKEAGNSNIAIFRHIRAAAESGWDFSSRWFRDKNKMSTIYTTDIVPIDLNCLMFHLEKLIGYAYSLKKDETKSKKYHQLSADREAAIHKYLWDDANGIFADYDLGNEKPTGVASAAMVFPLFLKVATKMQAERTSQEIDHCFIKAGGLISTLSNNGQQWDAPNGWAPLQWVAYKGLMNYEFVTEAKKIKTNWTTTIENVFRKTGKITEKYNVVDTNVAATGGEYPNQDGFGWTNGVYLKLKLDSSG
jgi:alpha,alpha-trehalase